MSVFVELSIDQIKIDKENPRIANYLSIYDPEKVTSDTIALLLGTKLLPVRAFVSPSVNMEVLFIQ